MTTKQKACEVISRRPRSRASSTISTSLSRSSEGSETSPTARRWPTTRWSVDWPDGLA